MEADTISDLAAPPTSARTQVIEALRTHEVGRRQGKARAHAHSDLSLSSGSVESEKLGKMRRDQLEVTDRRVNNPDAGKTFFFSENMGPVGIEVWRMSNTTIIMTRASMTISLRGYKTSKWHCTARRRNARERARKEWARSIGPVCRLSVFLGFESIRSLSC